MGEKKAAIVVGDLLGKGGEREVTEGSKGGVGGGEIGRVVERRLGGEGAGSVFGRREHRGGVGFHEETIERNFLVELAEAGVARGEVGGVEGEVGAEGGERRDHFSGATVGVKQEAARGEATRGMDGLERLEEQAEGVDAVDRGGAVECDGESKLGFEDRELFVEWGAAEAGEARIVGAGAVEHPAVEADFTHGGARIGGEISAESFEPGGRTVSDIPRVEAVARKQLKG